MQSPEIGKPVTRMQRGGIHYAQTDHNPRSIVHPHYYGTFVLHVRPRCSRWDFLPYYQRVRCDSIPAVPVGSSTLVPPQEQWVGTSLCPRIPRGSTTVPNPAVPAGSHTVVTPQTSQESTTVATHRECGGSTGPNPWLGLHQNWFGTVWNSF
jgi:hypothetical protein